MAKQKGKQSKKRDKTTPKWMEPFWPYLAVMTAGALLMFFARLHFLDFPFDRDEGAYGYLGWMALSGGTPYIDFYEMKPPLLFYSYAVIVAFFGKLPVGFHLAALLIHAFEAYIVFRLGQRLLNSVAGAIATLCFVIWGMNFQGVGFALQSEHIVLAYALPGLLLTLKGAEQQRARTLFWGGLLLACSVLVKQSAIFYCLAGVLIVALHAIPLRRWPRKSFLRGAGRFVLGALLPVAFFLGLMLVTGAMDAFWYWIYEHPTQYVSQRSVSQGMEQLQFFGSQIAGHHWVWIVLTGLGLLALPFIRTGWRKKVIFAAFFVLSFLAIVPGMRFYGHYWLLFFPACSLLAAGGFDLVHALLDKLKVHPLAHWIPPMLLASILVYQVISLGAYYYQSDLSIISKRAYQDNYFPEHQLLGKFLADRVQKTDDLIVLGSEPQIYLYTNKKAPTRHFYLTFTSKEIPEALRWEDEVIAAISDRKPEYIVFMYEPYSWMFREQSRRKLYNWAHSLCRTRYEAVAHIDLFKGLHVNQLLVGDAARNHNPRSSHYITVYRRNEQ